MLKPLLFSITLIPAIAIAKPDLSKRNVCKSLKSCSKVASRVLDQKYFYSGDLKGSVELSKGLVLNKDNAEELFTDFLNMHGYTRVEVESGVYKIIKARDIRYTPTKIIRYTASEPHNIPDLSDYYMATFKLKNPENARGISRSFRPFMSRYGRIIEVRSSGGLIIQDTGKNLRRLASLINEMDTPITDDMREERKVRASRRHEIELMHASNCSNKGAHNHRELRRK